VFYKAVPAQYVSNPVGLPSSYCVKKIRSIEKSSDLIGNRTTKTLPLKYKSGALQLRQSVWCALSSGIELYETMKILVMFLQNIGNLQKIPAGSSKM
jgi:hypothetical protein